MIIKFRYEDSLSIDELNKLIHDLETYDLIITEHVDKKKTL
jgi:hypothetical protein